MPKAYIMNKVCERRFYVFVLLRDVFNFFGFELWGTWFLRFMAKIARKEKNPEKKEKEIIIY